MKNLLMFILSLVIVPIRFVWELPQSLIGLFILVFHAFSGNIERFLFSSDSITVELKGEDGAKKYWENHGIISFYADTIIHIKTPIIHQTLVYYQDGIKVVSVLLGPLFLVFRFFLLRSLSKKGLVVLNRIFNDANKLNIDLTDLANIEDPKWKNRINECIHNVALSVPVHMIYRCSKIKSFEDLVSLIREMTFEAECYSMLQKKIQQEAI